MLVDLMTKAGENLTGTPWTVYPRPQMKRGSYLNLNGEWDFSVDYENQGKIRVPFCPESRLSGIGKHYEEGSLLCYSRSFRLPEGFNRGRVLLHIGAADQRTDIFLNGKPMGTHKGGYDAFCVDITEQLQEENRLQICCFDDLTDHSYPYGKQTMKRGGMWYTPVSGIWQTVWLESVPETYIEKLHIDNRGAAVVITTEPALDGTATVAGLGSYELKGGTVTIAPKDPHFWSPEDPYLYEFTLEAGEDKVESYFAIRTLEIKKVGAYQRLCLNGKPYFFHGLLDQGYWPDGLFTPATAECFAEDILAMKRLGFNTLRKHIKVEPEEFYYQCDKLGMIVFQDMVNNGKYHYAKDTILPTVSLLSQKLLPDRKMHRDELTRKRFLDGMKTTVNQLKNHPCICYWTIFNEGWGQFDSDAAYDLLKQMDGTRFIDSTSGWFRRFKTDVDSRHVYFRKITQKAADKPLVISEFGGYSYKVAGHSFNPDETYGYGKYQNRENFVQSLQALYADQVVPCIKRGLCAAIYTQVSDVEDETNGLLTYDRKAEKVTSEEMVSVTRALSEAMEESE